MSWYLYEGKVLYRSKYGTVAHEEDCCCESCLISCCPELDDSQQWASSVRAIKGCTICKTYNIGWSYNSNTCIWTAELPATTHCFIRGDLRFEFICVTEKDRCGYCSYEWDGANWSLLDDNCTPGCTCSGPPTDPGTVIDEVQQTLCTRTGACGTCFYRWDGVKWDFVSNSCDENCGCSGPPLPSEAAGTGTCPGSWPYHRH